MNGFEKRKERKKINILHAAFELFSEYGVQKVSIQEIAKKAQVSQVTIYNYFGGKDQLLFETVKTFTYEQLDQFRQVVQDEYMDFQSKISLFINSKNENVLHLDPDFIQSIMADQPEIQAFIQTFKERDAVPLLMELVDQGKKEGYVHPDFSFRTILFYVEMYDQALRSTAGKFQTSNQDLPASEEIMQLFFFGLMGNKDQPMNMDV